VQVRAKRSGTGRRKVAGKKGGTPVYYLDGGRGEEFRGLSKVEKKKCFVLTGSGSSRGLAERGGGPCKLFFCKRKRKSP